jgi:hypothetical protein
MPTESSPAAPIAIRIIKHFVWLLILVDFVILLWVGIQEPEIYQALADQTKTLISAVVWGLAFIGLVAGGVLTNGFRNFDLFLEDTRVQIAVVFLTATLIYAFIHRSDLIQLTSTMVVKVVPDWRESANDFVSGRVELKVSGAGGAELTFSDNLILSDSTVFIDVPPKREYYAVFEPANFNDVSSKAEKRATTVRGRNIVVLPVQRIRYGSARFVIDCGSSGHSLLIPGTIRIMKDNQEVKRANSSELVRLRADEYVIAGVAQRGGDTQTFRYSGDLRVPIRAGLEDTTFVIKARIIH